MNGRLPRIGVDEALRIICASTDVLDAETVAVHAALDRLAAGSVRAALNVPRFDVSAMDGYAVRAADIASASAVPVVLELAQAVPAGVWPPALPPGAAIPISTGTAIPSGADTVVIREAARQEGSRLIVSASSEWGRNIRRLGEDASDGSEVLPAGSLITPDAIGALYACGVGGIRVRRRPVVGLMSTGGELVEDVGDLAGPADLIDSNAPMILTASRALGLPVRFVGRAADRVDALDAVFGDLVGPDRVDICLSTGGVSAGEFDLVRSQLDRHGARILFHGIGMRPGKPLLFAQLPDGRLYFGLPGNPVAAMVGFRFFVLAAIRRMLGLRPECGRRVTVEDEGREGVSLFLRAREVSECDGRQTFDTGLDQRSHVMRSLVAADHFIRVDRRADGSTSSLAFPKVPTPTQQFYASCGP